jgi:hypothetical protein
MIMQFGVWVMRSKSFQRSFRISQLTRPLSACFYLLLRLASLESLQTSRSLKMSAAEIAPESLPAPPAQTSLDPALPERSYDASQPAPSLVLAPYYSPARSLLPAFLGRLAYFIVYGGSILGFLAFVYQVCPLNLGFSRSHASSKRFLLPRILKTKGSIAKLVHQQLLLYTGFHAKLKDTASVWPELRETVQPKSVEEEETKLPISAPEKLATSLDNLKASLDDLAVKQPAVEGYMSCSSSYLCIDAS